MNFKGVTLFLLSSLCILSSTRAFNITKILSNYPQFSTFDSLLSQTGLVQEINSRRTITVLVVSNNGTSSISGKPIDIVKRILSSHVILDYFDKVKLSNLQKKSSILTTLYQTSGVADDQQGFLNVTKTPEGVFFGSAMKGTPVTSSLVATVMTQPYNISVLEVSQIIEAPGIENLAPPPASKSSPPASAPKTSPSSPTPKTAPTSPAPKISPSAETPSEAPASDSDDESPEAPSETPSDAPSPTEADSPTSFSPDADQLPADGIPAPAPKTSGTSRVTMSIVAAAMIVSLSTLSLAV